MPRRGENIYKRKDGRWEGRYLDRTDSHVKGKYYSVYGTTYKEVKNKLLALQEKGNLRFQKDEKITMEEIIWEWMEKKKQDWKESTYSSYLRIIEKQILPEIWNIPADKFTLNKYEEFFRKKQHIVPALSFSYLHQMDMILSQSMKYFQESREKECIRYHFRIKKEKSKGVLELPTQQIRKLETYLIGHAEDNTCLGILLAAYTGIRLGEVCALQWKDIDLDHNILYIHKTMQRILKKTDNQHKTGISVASPKSYTSDRCIPIPDFVADILRANQKEKDCYIMVGNKKPFAEPRTVQYRFAKLLRQLEIPEFHFHLLRHHFATKCLEYGFDIKTISELLGHSNPQITMNIYLHSDMERKRNFMQQFQTPL